MARRLPGLRLGPVRSPGQGFIPLSGNLPAGAMFTAVRLGPVRSPGKKGRFVARIRRCSIL